MKPASGRPLCPSMSIPDQWGVTAGDETLKQIRGETTDDEITELMKRARKTVNKTSVGMV